MLQTRIHTVNFSVRICTPLQTVTYDNAIYIFIMLQYNNFQTVLIKYQRDNEIMLKVKYL